MVGIATIPKKKADVSALPPHIRIKGLQPVGEYRVLHPSFMISSVFDRQPSVTVKAPWLFTEPSMFEHKRMVIRLLLSLPP